MKPAQHKFTKNEKAVLLTLIDDCKTPDTKIAERLRITTQAVGKIRKKLEEEGIITRYVARIDFEKVGLNGFCVVLARAKPESWKNSQDKLIESIRKTPCVIDAYHIMGNEVCIAALLGFTDMEEMEKFFHNLCTEFDHIEIVEMFPFSMSSVIKRDPTDMIRDHLQNPESHARLPTICK